MGEINEETLHALPVAEYASAATKSPHPHRADRLRCRCADGVVHGESANRRCVVLRNGCPP